MYRSKSSTCTMLKFLIFVSMMAFSNADLAQFNTARCGQNTFDCGTDDICIHASLWRDCYPDCKDGSDEACETGYVLCDGCTCALEKRKELDCVEHNPFFKIDTKLCRKRPLSLSASEVLECDNGNCILFKLTNNVVNDCGDWSDENFCKLGFSRCESTLSECRFSIATRSIKCVCFDKTMDYDKTTKTCFPRETTTATTVTPPTTTIAPAYPTPTVCAGSRPSVPTYDTVSLGIVYDTADDMSVFHEQWLSTVFGVIIKWFTANVDRVENIVLVPMVVYSSMSTPATTSTTALQFLENVNNVLYSTRTEACNRRIMANTLTAIEKMKPNSQLVIVTSGTVRDGTLQQSVKKAAMAKRIRLFFILADGTCRCNCASSTTDAAIATKAIFTSLTSATHGWVMDVDVVSETVVNYSPAMKIVTADAFLSTLNYVAPSDTAASFQSITVDSGMKDIVVIGSTDTKIVPVTATGVSFTMLDAVRMSERMTPVYADDVIMAMPSTNGLRMSSLSFPEIKLAFAPKLASAATLDVHPQPWFGVTTNLIVGIKNIDQMTLTVTRVQIVQNSIILLDSAPTAVTRADISATYSYSVGPFTAPCTSFDVIITGTNACGEVWSRMSRTSMTAIDVSKTVAARTSVCAASQFMCGDLSCIAASLVGDCTAHCDDGSDEVLPKTDTYCTAALGGNPCQVTRAPTTTSTTTTTTATTTTTVLLDPTNPRKFCGEPNHFECTDALKCIPWDWVRDGQQDCSDNSDETTDLTTTTVTTTTTKFAFGETLPPIYSTTISPPTTEIDWMTAFWSDSCNVTSVPLFQCSNGQCIPLANVRDGMPNCPDGIDELCPSGYIACSFTNRCVLDTALNKAIYASGSGDEASAAVIPDQHIADLCLVDDMQMCASGDFCVLFKHLLDGMKQCPDMSDEEPYHLNECYLGLANCHEHATCTNNPNGRYLCTCKFGYNGDGVTVCDEPHVG